MPASSGSLLPFVGGGKGGAGSMGGFLKGRKRAAPGTAGATGAAPTAAAATKGNKKALTQTYLDLGQKSHGKRTLCGSCGMLYVNGEAEDERDHAAFCRSAAAALGFPGWKAERLVWGKEGKDRVVEVRPGDGPAALHKMAEVKRVVDREMGFVPLAEGEKALGPQEKAFLFVQAKRVVGYLVAEKVVAAFPVLTEEQEQEQEAEEEGKEEGGKENDHGDAQQKQGQQALPSSSTTTTTAAAAAAAPAGSSSLLPKGVAYSVTGKAPASLGVKQIWVGQGSRRQGLAKRMVEVARAKFYYGFVVPREQLAFSQLSTQGYAFARAYTAGRRLLVY